MRTHGWAGELPADEQQARGRLLTAARRLMTDGASPSTAEVARAVGVSRQTVYRYYRTTEELLDAAALAAVADLVDQLSAHVDDVVRSQRCDHADVLVEVVLWVALRLRDDPVLLRLVTPGRLSRTVQGFTEPAALALGRELLERMPVDWSALGVDGPLRTELVEHLLRVLQTLVVDPGDRTPEQWRAYLGRWLAPAVRAAGG